ncbi:MAG: alkaline phosphatase family protein [Chloroflexia bacterium]
MRRCARWCSLWLTALLLAACTTTPAIPTPGPSPCPAAFAARPTLPATATPRATPPPTATPLPTATPAPLPVEHVLLISVDGLTPAALEEVEVPSIARLRSAGVFAWHAQTVLPSVTLPAHAAMLTGLPPEITGIDWNSWSEGEPYIGFPTVLALAHEQGLRVAAVLGKAKLQALFPPGSVDAVEVAWGDRAVAERSARRIEELRPALLFVHLSGVDAAGHTYGWMSEEYLEAVREADQAIGVLLEALEKAGIAARTAVLLVSDHGGHGRVHGSSLPEDTTIVWMLSGPGIARGKEIPGVWIYDTAPTVLYLLGLPVPDNWQGRVIREAFGEEPGCLLKLPLGDLSPEALPHRPWTQGE